MQELEKVINIYHTACLVCLILGCMFLVISVLLFFKFDIRKIVDIRTGRGAKKAIQNMEEINAKTGKLRPDMVAYTPSVLRPEDRVTYPVTAPVGEGAQETSVLSLAETKDIDKPKIKLPGTFIIEKEIMWVHSQEVL